MPESRRVTFRPFELFPRLDPGLLAAWLTPAIERYATRGTGHELVPTSRRKFVDSTFPSSGTDQNSGVELYS